MMRNQNNLMVNIYFCNDKHQSSQSSSPFLKSKNLLITYISIFKFLYYRLIVILLATRMNCQSCSTPSLSLFPRELGGLLGDTEITAFDFATSASAAYLAVGGTSSSGDVVAHAGSAFITFEDALDYQMLWAKEYYLSTYAGQSLSVSRIIIDLTNNVVYVSILKPAIVLKINSLTGVTLTTSVVKYNSADYSTSVSVYSMGHFPTINSLILYVVDSSNKDYVMTVSTADMTSAQASYLMFASAANVQNTKQMEFMMYTTTPFAACLGLATVSGTLKSVLMQMTFGAGTISPTMYQISGFVEAFAAGALIFDSSGHYSRLVCLMSNADILAGGGYNIGVHVQQSLLFSGVSISMYYSMYTGSSIQYMCRDVIITSDFRHFMFLDVVDASSQKYLQVNEFSSFQSSGVIQHVTQTILQSYQQAAIESSFFGVFPNNGSPILMYSVFGTQAGNTMASTYNRGLLFYGYLAALGSSPVVSSLGCGTAASTSSTMTIPAGTASTWSGVSGAASVFTFSLMSDSTSYQNLQSQDLLQYQVFQSGCPGASAPSPIPLLLPTIQQPLYYVIGVDSLNNQGLKTFAFTPNTGWAALTQCQKDLVAYEIRMKDGTSMPAFLAFTRSTLSIWANNPTAPADVGTFVMQIVLGDVYGNSATLDVTIQIGVLLTSPTGIGNCYSEAVVPQGYAFDTMYVLGTYKQTKFQMQLPRNSLFVTCQPLLMVTANLLDASNNPQPLPSFMTVDIPNRQLITYLPRANGQALTGTQYTVQVWLSMSFNPTPPKSFTFKVYISASIQSGCNYYYRMLAPTIPDYVIQGVDTTTFTPFQVSNPQCNSGANILKRAVQQNMQPLPTCVTVDFTIMTINVAPNLCSGSFPLKIAVRLDAWINDLGISQKALQNCTEFSIIIISTSSCNGDVFILSSKVSQLFDTAYSNVDSPQTIQQQYPCGLIVQPSSLYNYIINPTSCDSATQYFQVSIVQDNWFYSPAFVSLPSPSTPSYYVAASSQIQANQGIYDIRIQGRYYNSDLTTFYLPLVGATVYLNYHIYKASNCQIQMGQQLSGLQYYIKKTNDVMVIQFNAFIINSDGCIYDQFAYDVTCQDGSSMPSFITAFDQLALTLTIQTSDVLLAGQYPLQLSANLNPYLYQVYPFVINMIEYIYPNLAAPYFTKGVVSPQVMDLGETLTIQLSSIKDIDKDKYAFTVYYINGTIVTTNLPSFIKFDSSQNKFTLTPSNMSDVGMYHLYINLTDLNVNPKYRIYPLDIEVDQYSQSFLASLLAAEMMSANMKVQYVGVNVTSVTSDGMLVIKFNVSIFNQSLGIQQFNNKSLNIKMVKAFTGQIYAIPWTVKNLTNDTLLIKLNFSDPSTVSMFSLEDSLVIKFNKDQQLLNQVGNGFAFAQQSGLSNFSLVQFQITQDIVLKNLIPKQTEGTSTSTLSGGMAAAASFAQGSANALLFGSFFLNIIMASSMQMLWGTINTLQLIILATLFNISYPSNAMVLFKIISQITQFNIVPVYVLINKWLTFTPQITINNNFYLMGYPTCSSLQNLNTSLLFLPGIAIAMALTLIIDIVVSSNETWMKKFKPIRDAVFFSATIRILLESQIELTVNSTINVNQWTYTTMGDKISALFSLMLIPIMYLSPFVILFFILTQFKHMGSPDTQTQYGSLYEGLKYGKRMQVFCNFIFTSRRLILILFCIYFGDYPAFQIIVYIVFSQINIMYLIHYRPYEDPRANVNEIFNEACILAVSYQLFIFTDFVPSQDIKNQAGYGLIVITVGNFVVNLILQVIQMFKQIPPLVRKLKTLYESLTTKVAKKEPEIFQTPVQPITEENFIISPRSLPYTMVDFKKKNKPSQPPKADMDLHFGYMTKPELNKSMSPHPWMKATQSVREIEFQELPSYKSAHKAQILSNFSKEVKSISAIVKSNHQILQRKKLAKKGKRLPTPKQSAITQWGGTMNDFENEHAYHIEEDK